jgi:hypothetical protein
MGDGTGQFLDSKVAKVANCWWSGVGDLAGQKLVSKVAK